MSDASFPYDTRLNVLFPPLEKISLDPIVAGVTHPWFNQTLCQVNDSVVRMGVMRCVSKRRPSFPPATR